jgi:hypothetical protein
VRDDLIRGLPFVIQIFGRASNTRPDKAHGSRVLIALFPFETKRLGAVIWILASLDRRPSNEFRPGFPQFTRPDGQEGPSWGAVAGGICYRRHRVLACLGVLGGGGRSSAPFPP